MESRPLFAPWRMAYIRGLDKPAPATGDCFLCDAATAANEAEFRARLVLWVTAHSVVLLNAYPYTNGHLLIAPRAHKAELEELGEAEQLDLQVQTTRAVQLLKRAISPQGFNLGMNLGRMAGAGLPNHLHQHAVPRWGGDTNFMSVVGEVRVVPEALSRMYEELVRVGGEMGWK